MKIAATGHRPNKLGGYTQEAFDKLVEIATEYLLESKPDKVISGMALGWDQAVAQAAKDCGIPYIAAVPFHGQEKRWPWNSQEYFKYLLQFAEEVVFVSDGAYQHWMMQKRNEWMVDNCDILLAMYDGTKGGTANCINYAQKQGKSIVNLYDKLINRSSL